MNQEDIISMAREAGFAHSWSEAAGQALERFAVLVAAAEREACARECWEFYSIEGIAQKCNTAIRARGNSADT